MIGKGKIHRILLYALTVTLQEALKGPRVLDDRDKAQ